MSPDVCSCKPVLTHPCKAGCCNLRSWSDQNGEVGIKVLRFVLKQSREQFPPLPVPSRLEINRGALSCPIALRAGSPLSVCSPGFKAALGQHQWCQACHEALRALSAVRAAPYWKAHLGKDVLYRFSSPLGLRLSLPGIWREPWLTHKWPGWANI